MRILVAPQAFKGSLSAAEVARAMAAGAGSEHQCELLPVADGGELKTRPSGHLTTPQEWIECFSNIAAHKPCNLTTPAITPKPEHK